MNKKILKIGVLSIITLLVVYFVVFMIQNYLISKSLEKYTLSYYTENLVKYQTVRCNLNILEPRVAFIDYSKDLYDKNVDDFSVDFHYLENIFDIKNNNWTDTYTGGTTIKKTTFPQLLAMVKEDCSQFQETFYQGDDNKLWWTYTKYNPKPKKTPEEIEQERLEDKEYDRKVESGEIIEDTRSLEEILEEIRNE